MTITIPILFIGEHGLRNLAFFLAMGMLGTIITGIGAYYGLNRWRIPLRILAVTLGVPGFLIYLGWLFSRFIG